jgi:S1-C subfamily serine protease
MKNKCAKIITLLLALIACLSLIGCEFGTTENGGGNTPNGATGLIAPVNLPNSITQSSSIVFAEDTAVRQGNKLSLEEAAAKVRGSSVMIAVATETEAGAACGVIVDINDGKSNEDTIFYILTCAHVCKQNAAIKVFLPDENFRYNENEDYVFSGVIGGKKESVQNNAITLVGADETSDVAVLRLNISGSKLTADDITEATVIPSEYGVNYAEQVFAIGNPSGTLPGSVTTGIVSYLNRQISFEDFGVMTLMQIDVTTHAGSSGGGLFNMYGELIGITNAGKPEYAGLNFAIPHKIAVSEGKIDNGFINIARQLIGTAVANDFNNYGYVSGRETKMGIVVTEENGSVVIKSVSENSYASKNGFAANDVITNVRLYKANGNTLTESKNIVALKDFTEIMDRAVIGDKVIITLQRKVQSGLKYYLNNIEKEFVVSQYYFCDTGVYPQA